MRVALFGVTADDVLTVEQRRQAALIQEARTALVGGTSHTPFKRLSYAGGAERDG